MPHTFGLIAEGPTDHAVLENILIGFFNDPDLSQYIRPLQPLRDETDDSFAPGGWSRIVEYCKSDVFLGALEHNEFLVIQIDTDCVHEAPFDLTEKGMLSIEELIEAVKSKFQELFGLAFGEEFLTSISSRLIFAIAVHSIECWLLPLFYSDHHAGAANNCLNRLNEKLVRVGRKPVAKNYRYYATLSRDYAKNKRLMEHYPQNPSLQVFVTNLQNTPFSRAFDATEASDA